MSNLTVNLWVFCVCYSKSARPVCDWQSCIVRRTDRRDGYITAAETDQPDLCLLPSQSTTQAQDCQGPLCLPVTSQKNNNKKKPEISLGSAQQPRCPRVRWSEGSSTLKITINASIKTTNRPNNQCIRGFSTTMRYINRHYLSITGSAVALHCVKAHRQSQWRSPNFNPL